MINWYPKAKYQFATIKKLHFVFSWARTGFFCGADKTVILIGFVPLWKFEGVRGAGLIIGPVMFGAFTQRQESEQ